MTEFVTYDTLLLPNQRVKQMNYSKIEFQVENERRLEKLNNPKIKSFEGWKAEGKFVKKGERQKSYRVQCGTFSRMNPITGEMQAEPIFKLCYGFTADQVR